VEITRSSGVSFLVEAASVLGILEASMRSCRAAEICADGACGHGRVHGLMPGDGLFDSCWEEKSFQQSATCR